MFIIWRMEQDLAQDSGRRALEFNEDGSVPRKKFKSYKTMWPIEFEPP